MTDTPMNIEFQNLKRNRAYTQLIDHLENHVIQKAKNDFFLMDEEDQSMEQKLKVRHFEEFLKKLKTIVDNSCSKP